MIFGLVPLTLVALAVAYWTRWLAWQPRVPAWLGRILRWAYVVVIPTPAIGIMITIHGLRMAFAAVESDDPSQKARILAEGISEAMNATAFVIALLFVELVLLLVLTWRYHWSKAPSVEVPGSPPYR